MRHPYAIAILASVALVFGGSSGTSADGEAGPTHGATAVETTGVEASSPPVIPGLRAAALAHTLRDLRFACEQPQLRVRGAAAFVETVCDYTNEGNGGGAFSVGMIENDRGELVLVYASAAVAPGGPIDEAAQSFLGLMATLPYAGSQPDAAKRWVVAQVPLVAAGESGSDGARTATFGGVLFRLGSSNASLKHLLITGASSTSQQS